MSSSGWCPRASRGRARSGRSPGARRATLAPVRDPPPRRRPRPIRERPPRRGAGPERGSRPGARGPSPPRRGSRPFRTAGRAGLRCRPYGSSSPRFLLDRGSVRAVQPSRDGATVRTPRGWRRPPPRAQDRGAVPRSSAKVDVKRLLPLSGVAAVVLIFASFVPAGSTPAAEASAGHLAGFYTQHAGGQMAAGVLMSLGALLLVIFAATLADVLRREEEEAAPIPRTLPRRRRPHRRWAPDLRRAQLRHRRRRRWHRPVRAPGSPRAQPGAVLPADGRDCRLPAGRGRRRSEDEGVVEVARMGGRRPRRDGGDSEPRPRRRARPHRLLRV